MNRFYLVPLFIAFLSTASFGANDKYRAVVTDDPATTMTIGWNQISGHSVALFFDVEDHGTDYESYANFQLPDRTVIHKSMNNYFVRLKNLTPDTRYYFVIVDSEGVSDRFWFETLSDSPYEPISFIAGGDSRRSGSETTPHDPRIESNKMVKALRPDFVAFGGDYTDKNTDGQWQTWFDDWQYTIGDDGRMTPILPTRGNHEHTNGDVVNLFDCLYDDVYYAINFGGSLIRFYTLNSMISVAGAQTSWLAQDLEDNNAATAWKLAQYHNTIAPHTASKPYRFSQYTQWAPLFFQYALQLIIECDTHVARNSWPVKPSNDPNSDGGFIRDDVDGTVYAGEGSWGLVRQANVEYTWTREKGSFTQVKWVHVNLDSMVVYTIKSATSDPVAPVDDNNRFELPEGMDIWETVNGDRVVIKRPNPLYNPSVGNVEPVASPGPSFINSFFPNPAQNSLRVIFKDTQEMRYQVLSNTGQVMDSGNFLTQSNILDLSNLADGHYYLKVWEKGAENLFQVKRFIKQ